MGNDKHTGNQLEELKAEIEHLKNESEQKTAWISILSHDFKGTFSSFLWLIEAWEQKSIEESDFFKLLPEVKRNLQKNLKTVTDTEEWIRIYQKALKPEFSEINIAELFVQLQLEFKEKLHMKNIRLTLRKKKTENIFFDQQLVFFILKKLIDNAVKYSFPSSDIYLEVDQTENDIIFRVKDHGTGMDEKHLRSLFTSEAPVYQGTKNETGSGLSLKVVKNIVDLMNGSIDISANKNEGCMVSIFLKHYIK